MKNPRISAKAVLITEGRQPGTLGFVLALKRKGKWDLLGGGVNPCEPAEAAARREIAEEAKGLIVGALTPLCVIDEHDKEGRLKRSTSYFVGQVAVAQETIELSPEHQTLEVVSPEGVNRLPMAGRHHQAIQMALSHLGLAPPGRDQGQWQTDAVMSTARTYR